MLGKSCQFFYENGEIGADRYGEAITAIDFEKIEVFGEEYVSQHVCQYIKRYCEERSYRIYVTSCLQAIAENTTHYVTGKGIEDYGKSMQKSWAEIVDPPKRTKEEIELENVNIDEFTSEMFERIRGRRAKE